MCVGPLALPGLARPGPPRFRQTDRQNPFPSDAYLLRLPRAGGPADGTARKLTTTHHALGHISRADEFRSEVIFLSVFCWEFLETKIRKIRNRRRSFPRPEGHRRTRLGRLFFSLVPRRQMSE